MSAHAKSVLAALAAAIIIVSQAYQMATVDGFQLLDVLPIATALVGALLTRVVPNVPELPWAKTWVHGALAVLTALSTFVGSHPAGVTIANLGTVAVFSFLVWFVPEVDPFAAPLGPDGVPQVTSLPLPPALPVPADAPPAVEPATVDLPVHAVWTRTDLPRVPVAAGPTPIGDEAAAAAAAATAAASADTTPIPAVPAA